MFSLMIFIRKSWILLYRVIAMATPRMTGKNPPESQPTAFENAIFVNCVNAVLRAGWRIPAGIRQQRRNTVLIEFDKEYRNYFKLQFHYLTFNFRKDFPLMKPSILSPIFTGPTPSGVPV